MTEILQNEEEITALVEIFRQEGIRSYLEIGAKFGGSLQRIGEAMPAGSRIVAVDLPNGTKAWAQSSVSLTNVVAGLRKQGKDAQIIWGNSQDAVIVEQVRKLGPFDAILLDADHRLPGVTADWKNYGPMASSMVAFHDIAWRRAPEWEGTRIDVPQFWNDLKLKYRHREFKFCPTGKNNGIGVLWKISQP